MKVIVLFEKRINEYMYMADPKNITCVDFEKAFDKIF